MQDRCILNFSIKSEMNKHLSKNRRNHKQVSYLSTSSSKRTHFLSRVQMEHESEGRRLRETVLVCEAPLHGEPSFYVQNILRIFYHSRSCIDSVCGANGFLLYRGWYIVPDSIGSIITLFNPFGCGTNTSQVSCIHQTQSQDCNKFEQFKGNILNFLVDSHSHLLN